MDPGLHELMREHDDDEILEAIIKLRTPSVRIPGVRLVAQAGNIATCRLRRGDILRVHDDPGCLSLKAPKLLNASIAFTEPPNTAVLPTDHRRPASLEFTGRGVVIGFLDYDFDFTNPAFRHRDGTTRLLAMWDQRGTGDNRYGYGRIITPAEINAALREADPHAALGYRPAAFSHGTHVVDIAAGNGTGGTPCGIAPACDLIFVHISTAFTEGLANLGDSVRLLEALDFVIEIASHRKLVINISAGRHAGSHDGQTPAEQFLKNLAHDDRMIIQSAGNYFDKLVHVSGRLAPGATKKIAIHVNDGDQTSNEFEAWTTGKNFFDVAIEFPDGRVSGMAAPGEIRDLEMGGHVVGRMYNRLNDPTNGNNHINIFLYAHAPEGKWAVILRAREVTDGTYHAWIERDTGCAPCQSRFDASQADTFCTLSSLVNGWSTLVVGAYDPHHPDRPVGGFSSAGPTRDGRVKPDLVAPGVNILAARSPYHSRGPFGMRRSGTSMAAPHVAGTVALCLEAAGSKPLASQTLRKIIMHSTDHAPPQPLRYGSGYLNVARAVEYARSTDQKTNQGQKIFATMKTISRHAHRPASITHHAPQRDRSLDTIYRGLIALGSILGPFNRIHIIGWPGKRLSGSLRDGDMILKIATAQPGLGQLSIVRDERLLNPREIASSTEVMNVPDGYYALVTHAMGRDNQSVYASRLTSPSQTVLEGSVVLRIDYANDPMAVTQDAEVDAPALVNITHAGPFRIAYNRNNEVFGQLDPPSLRASRVFQGVAAMQSALDRFAHFLQRVESNPVYILTAGIYTTERPSSNHIAGIAVDIDGLWWSDTKRFLAFDASTDWPRYLRIEAALRKAFGMVLNADYNNAHGDHWHCELTGSVAWQNERSKVLFVQRALITFWDDDIVLDGSMGPKTIEALARNGFNFSVNTDWDRFLDVILNRGPFNASSEPRLLSENEFYVDEEATTETLRDLNHDLATRMISFAESELGKYDYSQLRMPDNTFGWDDPKLGKMMDCAKFLYHVLRNVYPPLYRLLLDPGPLKVANLEMGNASVLISRITALGGTIENRDPIPGDFALWSGHAALIKSFSNGVVVSIAAGKGKVPKVITSSLAGLPDTGRGVFQGFWSPPLGFESSFDSGALSPL